MLALLFSTLPFVAVAGKNKCIKPDSEIRSVIEKILSIKNKISSICQSPIKEIYEVVINNRQLIYVHPKSKTVIVGEFVQRGQNLTRKRMLDMGLIAKQGGEKKLSAADKRLSEIVVPAKGFTLPVKWGDLGKQMIDAGVIDKKKLEAVYSKRGGLSTEDKRLLYDSNNGDLKITSENSRFILNMLWALALGNKNDILEKGPMMRSGDASGYASTGGWTLAKGKAMQHYSKHSFLVINKEQQILVKRVAKNIYRPCCNNSTHFPDCNHGMAMLGLLELLASRGFSEKEMYRIALQVNSYWYPGTYLTIAKLVKGQGVEWRDVNSKEILGVNYSSSSGYRKILAKVNPIQPRGDGGCGV